MAAGLLTLAALPTNVPVLVVALVMVLVGGGGGLTVPPIASLIFDNAPGHLAGTASGVLNTFRQMGGSLGVAVFGAIMTRDMTSGVDGCTAPTSTSSGPPRSGASTRGPTTSVTG